VAPVGRAAAGSHRPDAAGADVGIDSCGRKPAPDYRGG
jgi:hypothetical protein